ncbi:GNAT family N-acetyltransferase, partial [Janibacter hoylei]|uniref:GNAT family N-acetyltransferase n=1 Tax=Janibacter hoylei TaxID=364298 RepID=UPI0036B18063
MIGAVARAEDADGVDIDRLVVDPAVHRRGAGRKLVQAVLFRAGHRRATVSTGRANLPARTLYRVDRPGSGGGCDLPRRMESCLHRGSIPMSCASE